ncbi:MAG: glycosyltransferase [Planctomycetes bacterium]|nr:glycosyltransferase [Planctomycetota bacterium]
MRLLESSPVVGKLIERTRQRRRQRDWATLFTAKVGSTTLRFYTTIGLGDVMIARQFCEAFEEYGKVRGDPGLGKIVISAGAWDTGFKLERGDHVVYWWWSMGRRDDWLAHYLNRVDVKPDVVACLSSHCVHEARSRGQETVYLPLAVGKHFRPAATLRKGIGFAGSKGHKDSTQELAIVRPFADRADFEWVDNLKTPQDLAAFYNRKQIVLGMTETRQEKTGMVNNRVFEVLATATPFILHAHRAIDEVLGVEYPYQSSSPEQTLELADRILNDYARHLSVFTQFSRRVLTSHTYDNRIATLIECLRTRG